MSFYQTENRLLESYLRYSNGYYIPYFEAELFPLEYDMEPTEKIFDLNVDTSSYEEDMDYLRYDMDKLVWEKSNDENYPFVLIGECAQPDLIMRYRIFDNVEYLTGNPDLGTAMKVKDPKMKLELSKLNTFIDEVPSEYYSKVLMTFGQCFSVPVAVQPYLPNPDDFNDLKFYQFSYYVLGLDGWWFGYIPANNNTGQFKNLSDLRKAVNDIVSSEEVDIT
jgi:hypothetical protein